MCSQRVPRQSLSASEKLRRNLNLTVETGKLSCLCVAEKTGKPTLLLSLKVQLPTGQCDTRKPHCSGQPHNPNHFSSFRDLGEKRSHRRPTAENQFALSNPLNKPNQRQQFPKRQFDRQRGLNLASQRIF